MTVLHTVIIISNINLRSTSILFLEDIMTLVPLEKPEAPFSQETATRLQRLGPGVPTFRAYAAESRRIVHYMVKGEFRTASNRSRSLLENFWNFQFHSKETNVECPCCGWQGPDFLSASNWRAIQYHSRCPGCGSGSRHRGLAVLLPELQDEQPHGPALIFAPEPALLTQIRALTGGQVQTTDFLRTDVDYPGEDIQQLSFADQSFSFVMCNHVLEHIPDDQQALLECARILKLGGLGLFTIPGDFPKKETWYFDTPDENGHLRHYGMDVIQKMERGFRRVDVVDMGLNRNPRWHVRSGDMAFLCWK
jgi:SAM-dependent methyltransferase